MLINLNIIKSSEFFKLKPKFFSENLFSTVDNYLVLKIIETNRQKSYNLQS